MSVYLDDFVGSHDDEETLRAAYEDIRGTLTTAGLIPNPNKLVPPAAAITAFNCDLTHSQVALTPERIAQYDAREDRTTISDAAFAQYQALVMSQNAPEAVGDADHPQLT